MKKRELDWSQEQIYYLTKSYRRKVPMKELMKELGRTESAIRLRVQKLGLHRLMAMDIEKDNATMERWRREIRLEIAAEKFRICGMEEPAEGKTDFVCPSCKMNHTMSYKFFKVLIVLKVKELKKKSFKGIAYNKALDDFLKSLGLK